MSYVTTDYRVTFVDRNITIEVLTSADDAIEALENAAEDLSFLHLDPTQWKVDFQILDGGAR